MRSKQGWIDLLFKCQGGFASCRYVADEILKEGENNKLTVNKLNRSKDNKIITLLDFCYHNNITVIFGATTAKINGVYNKFTRTITINWSMSKEKKYKIFLHEIGHWSMWYIKNRKHTEEEAEAEGLKIEKLLRLSLN